ncbi:MAG: glycosyltransferase family 4 protein [Bacteroidales bacterium]
MNILMILDGEFPPDERVEKEAISLIKEGNSVSILCLNYGNRKEHEDYNRISVNRIKIKRSLRNKLQATYLIFPFYRLFWERAIRKFLVKNQCEVIHFHDLPLSDIGIKLRKSFNVKIVCDQHEYYSNWIVNTAHYNTPVGRIVKYLSNWEAYEKTNLPEADMVITVEEPLKQIYMSELQMQSNKIIVLPNTPSSVTFSVTNVDQDLIKKYSDYFVIFYAGNIDILRGLNTVIEALPLLRGSVPNLKFLLAGRINSKYYDPIKYGNELGVSDLVEFVGWVPLSRLPSYVAASDICLHIPPAISREVNNTIASKIYQYVLMNKPVIVGQARMMKEFVEENKIGLSIKDSDPDDLAAKIKLMYTSPGLMNEYSENARKIADRYSWEVTSRPFIDFYRKSG